jgi:hypothetical protein
MAGGGGRVVVGLVFLPVVVGGLAGCTSGSGNAASAKASAAKAASVTETTAATLRRALLTHVNGVAAAAPASSGKYASVAETATDIEQQTKAGVQVTPKACAGPATEGFDLTALVAAPAAAVTFKVGANEVSEVLIASSGKSASTALAAQVPAECARYEEEVAGKTVTYGAKEQPFTGVGTQAKVLNVQAAGVASDNLWSLIYRGAGFVGTVTVVGPNASEKAVQELGQQAYAFAAKTLA